MLPEEQKQILATILQAAQTGDVALVSEKVTILSEDYGATNAALVLAEGKAAEFEAKNKALQEQNLALFLKQGSVVIDNSSAGSDEKPAFEDLFDPETGKLK